MSNHPLGMFLVTALLLFNLGKAVAELDLPVYAVEDQDLGKQG